jgi:hypothetical protein
VHPQTARFDIELVRRRFALNAIATPRACGATLQHPITAHNAGGLGRLLFEGFAALCFPMKSAALLLAAALLVACSGKSETPTTTTADGLTFHPSPGQTGDGIPVTAPAPAATVKSPTP